ncbi:uncharacterized protein si:ch73-266m14.1 [Pimephales promelas]|uniref:uncharacterized protein si:ch73-266m14.1 n=1 Tax=Pimephales promelas TaxID=90988 RepID=UPI001955A681|nr:uncharacterized protein si:ch73-266m14.1 [Pimephales promelas]
MVHIIISALLICGMGLLTVTASQTTNISAHPGDNITLWCQHTLQIGEYMHWFKQTNSGVPISIVRMMLHFNTEAVPTYVNDFKPDRLVMFLNRKNSSLSILNVDISDSGLYYCGWGSWVITFGDGTNIEIKERTITKLNNETYKVTNKDLKRSPISEKYCPGNIFYKLTFIFGGIVVILIIIIPLTLFIVKIRKTQEKDADQQVTEHHEDPHSTLYAALRFSKQKPRRAARHAEDADVVYSAIVQQYGPLA